MLGSEFTIAASTEEHRMFTHVHLVGSVALDTAQDVFSTAGKLLGPYLERIPDGEPGGRRLWISWQVPLLRANPNLQVVAPADQTGIALVPLRLADGASPQGRRARSCRR